MQCEVHRTEFENCSPIMVERQAGQTARVWLIIIAIPVIVLLPVIDSQIIKTHFGDRQLTSRVRISTEAAGVYRIKVREIIAFFGCSAKKVEFINTETLSQIEQLQILLLPAGNIDETIACSNRTLRLKAAHYRNRLILSRERGMAKENHSESDSCVSLSCPHMVSSIQKKLIEVGTVNRDVTPRTFPFCRKTQPAVRNIRRLWIHMALQT